MTILFLFVVIVALPFLAWSSYQYLSKAGPDADLLGSTTAFAIQTLAVHTVVLGLALGLAATRNMTISWVAPIIPVAALYAIATLGALLGWGWYEARRPLQPHEALRRHLRSVGVNGPWVAISAGAAVAEEVTYRAVLFGLATTIMPVSFAALLAAVVFGLGHGAQGPRGVVMSAAFGLLMQGLYALGGSLVLPIVVHFLYDVLAAWLSQRLQRTHPDPQNA